MFQGVEIIHYQFIYFCTFPQNSNKNNNLAPVGITKNDTIQFLITTRYPH